MVGMPERTRVQTVDANGYHLESNPQAIRNCLDFLMSLPVQSQPLCQISGQVEDGPPFSYTDVVLIPRDNPSDIISFQCAWCHKRIIRLPKDSIQVMGRRLWDKTPPSHCCR